MQGDLEKLVKAVYRRWKTDRAQLETAHPDEEAMACFLENQLPRRKSKIIKTHLIACDICAEKMALNLRLKAQEEREAARQTEIPILEILLRLKEKALEVLSTTGDILLGARPLPVVLLRSRKLKEFKDEVTILKEFKDIRVEAKIENKAGRVFDLTVKVTNKTTQEIIKDLRVTLIRDDLEIESYSADTGRVTFEHLFLGKYVVEIASLGDKLASIVLAIKI